MASDEHSGRTAIYTLAGVIGAAILTLAATIGASTIAFISAQRSARTAYDAQMVQIGVEILSADPSKSDVAPARGWAIELVEKHSGQPFSPEDRESLLHHPLDFLAKGFWGAALDKPMLVKCDPFHKKSDGSWESNSRKGPPIDWSTEKFLNLYCNDPIGMRRVPSKTG